jgi:hypothetical protein
MSEERDLTSLVDLIDRLVDAPAPPPVSMMPQTPGWAVLAVLLVAGAVALALHLRKRRRADAFRREALTLLKAAGDDPVAIAAILRRAALVARPRVDIAGLSGAAWLAALDQGMDGAPFSTGPGRALANAPYRPDPAPVPGLGALARKRLETRLKPLGARA